MSMSADRKAAGQAHARGSGTAQAPAAYLLDVSRTLTDLSLMERVMLVMRRAAGLLG
jgi:hypothetical protein